MNYVTDIEGGSCGMDAVYLHAPTPPSPMLEALLSMSHLLLIISPCFSLQQLHIGTRSSGQSK